MRKKRPKLPDRRKKSRIVKKLNLSERRPKLLDRSKRRRIVKMLRELLNLKKLGKLLRLKQHRLLQMLRKLRKPMPRKKRYLRR